MQAADLQICWAEKRDLTVIQHTPSGAAPSPLGAAPGSPRPSTPGCGPTRTSQQHTRAMSKHSRRTDTSRHLAHPADRAKSQLSDPASSIGAVQDAVLAPYRQIINKAAVQLTARFAESGLNSCQPRGPSPRQFDRAYSKAQRSPGELC